jgi:predicted GH43/DUF377 family glycosyl hydrolase
MLKKISIVLIVVLVVWVYIKLLSHIKLKLPDSSRANLPDSSVVISEKYFNPSKVYDENNKEEIIFLRSFVIHPVFNSDIIVKKNNTLEKLPIINNITYGYEDARAIYYNKNIYLFVSGRDSKTKIFHMYIMKYNSKGSKAINITYPFKTFGHNKNFMPFVVQGKLYFIFSIVPKYIVLEMILDKNGEITGETKVVNEKSNEMVYRENKKLYLKGSTKGCEYNNYIYFGVHSFELLDMMIIKGGRHYVNYILVVEKTEPFNIVRLSKPFILTDNEIILSDIPNSWLDKLLNFGISHINFLTDMNINKDGVVEFLYGYDDISSHSIICNNVENLF